MRILRIYTENLKIAKGLINKDKEITKQYYFKDSYPLLESIYDNYHIDCNSCVEFMHEIYILMLTPSKKTGRCHLENYKDESTLCMWLRSVCLFYCYGKFERKQHVSIIDITKGLKDDNDKDVNYSFLEEAESIDIDMSYIDHMDAETILNSMPNKYYSMLFCLLYLEERANEETTEALGMLMKCHYNKHELAKAQYNKVRKGVRI